MELKRNKQQKMQAVAVSGKFPSKFVFNFTPTGARSVDWFPEYNWIRNNLKGMSLLP